jgi:membrane protease YdiL (CAAX protease family)
MAKSAVTSNRDELFQFAIMGKKGVRAMNNITPETPANIYAFFILTFLLSLPFYVFAFLVPPEMALLAGLTLTLAPVSAALILVFRQNRSSGAKILLKRAFDYKRIPKARWFIPILLLWPVIFSLAFLGLNSIGEPIPDTAFPIVAAPVALLVFFLLALFEEVGWMGYAFDPLEQRSNALIGSLILGLIWSVWHLPIFIATPESTTWIVGQLATLVLARILIAWIFNNTGKSVFAVILFHTVYNLCTMVIPVYGSSLGPGLTAVVTLITTISIVFLWGANTLARFRFSSLRKEGDQTHAG